MSKHNNPVENDNEQSYESHVHDFLGNTNLTGPFRRIHNHHVAGVTDEPIRTDKGNHKHRIKTNTSCKNHYHEIDMLTGPAVSVGGGQHVHLVDGQTTSEDNHCHRIKFTTLKNHQGGCKHYCNDESTDEDNENCGNHDNCPSYPSDGGNNEGNGNNGGDGSNNGSDCTATISPVKCKCLPLAGACVPLALGYKSKQDVQSKIDRLVENTQVPSVLAAVFFETARRFTSGQAARTPIEANLYSILRGLSSGGRSVLSCCLNVLDSLPASQRNKLLSPFIRSNTNLTADNIVNLLADEIIKVASQKFLGNPEALQNPRPGRARIIPGNEVFPPTLDPDIFFINGIRTGLALALDGVNPGPEEVEKTCTINQQNQQICTVQTPPCPGNSTVGFNPVCLRVQHVLGGDLVVLQGINFFTTDAKVIMASKTQPSLRRVIPTIVYGDIDTPIFDEQGKRITDTRVKDRLVFTVPQDLPDGIYTIQVEVVNNNADVLTPVPKTYTSSTEYLRILPPPTTNFQILAESLKCVEETSGPGSDEVALNFLTTLLTGSLITGTVEISDLSTREFRFEDFDSGETRPINFAPVQANNLLGVNITIKGYEVDNEDAYKEQITEFGEAYWAGLKSMWASVASSLGSSIAGAIAAAAGATFAVGTLIVGAVAAVLANAVAFFYALWAPADPIIEDAIGLTLVQLADLTSNSGPVPPQTTTFTPEDIKVIVDSLEKNVEFRQLRGYISEAEESLYQIILRYSRF